MKNNNRKNWLRVFLYSFVSLLGLVVAGCGAQSGLMTRPQPIGGEIVNPWLPTQEREFNALENSFQEQISRTEELDPDSLEVRKLKSEYEKVKRLWRLQKKESNSKFPKVSELPDAFVNSVGITMKLVKPGTFMMGEKNKARRVTIAKPFYIGVYEITGNQYARVMGGSFSPAPKTYVSWNDAVGFCQKLSTKEGLNYSLPTEAQWEYACRAGTTTAYSFGNQWSEAASRQSNPWGLYDMHGNLWEWCSDWYSSNQNYRVLRSGSPNSAARFCRSANRFCTPYIQGYYFGFRVVLSVSSQDF